MTTTNFETEVEKHALSLVMPNGKPLAQCTAVECGQLGSWLTHVSTEVIRRVGYDNPDAIHAKVGDVMSNAEVANMLMPMMSPEEDE